MASGQTLRVFTPLENQSPAANFARPDRRNGHPVLDFKDAATNESAIFGSVLPQNYAGGGCTVYLHVGMSTATSGDTDWDVSFERVGDGEQDIDSDGFAAVQSSDNQAVPAAAGKLGILSVAFTDGAQMDSLAAGEGFRVKVTRNGADDTASGDAELWAVELRET